MTNLPDGSQHRQASCLKRQRHCLESYETESRPGARRVGPVESEGQRRGGGVRAPPAATTPSVSHCNHHRRHGARLHSRNTGCKARCGGSGVTVSDGGGRVRRWRRLRQSPQNRRRRGVRLHRGHAGWGRRRMGPAADGAGSRRRRRQTGEAAGRGRTERRMGADGGGDTTLSSCPPPASTKTRSLQIVTISPCNRDDAHADTHRPYADSTRRPE